MTDLSKKIIVTALVAGLLGFLVGIYPEWNSNPDNDRAGNDGSLELVSGGIDASYVCPMHAHIVADQPGSCPVCGMGLVRNEATAAAGADEGRYPKVTIAPAVVHNLGIRTATAERGDLERSIETIGKITRVDPMARRTLTPPIRGELTYVADKHSGDLVEQGELLFAVASPELFELEQSFQESVQSGDRASTTAMIPRLRSMGLSPEQIARLQEGEPPTLPAEVYAFENGFVYTGRGKVGEPVHTGFTIFNVGGNYRVIEVTAEIFERQWGWVEEGQAATMTVRGLPGSRFEGRVVRVEPPVGYTTRSLEVALKFKTDDPGLSQSMFAHVSIAGQPRQNVLLVPRDAVIRTGEGERVVRMHADGSYQPVSVVAGEEAGGMVEIKSGLRAGDQVVASGQFLVDSESNLLSGFRRMATPGLSNEMHHEHARGHGQKHRQAQETGGSGGGSHNQAAYRQVKFSSATVY